ncbi:SDR family NAD(P)-dependent oxidoreductase [Nocardioides houyundeii]|uniref:SDR family NAD(P)-dependent oxidoreductase n=1 Tax=Nocardioides houyundeii TaxID=2045452 RepID=UPI0013B42A3B|nr:SDR family oxidoreductase [Nocardioides houyundeii]
MIDVGFDFTGRHVLVTGGTRGLGLAVAQAFLDAGARVSITGTKILPSLYDADLSRLEYHQLRLASSDAIESFVERIGALDVLVNTAGARLSTDLAEHEREFLCHSARLGFVGPLRLTQQLRPRLCASRAPGGGAVIHAGSTAKWLELTQTPADAEAELVAQTSRTGRAWQRLGSRVNMVLPPPRFSVPHQQRGHFSSYATTGDSALLTRPRTASGVTAEQIASVILFLSSGGAAAVTGQTIRTDATR